VVAVPTTPPKSGKKRKSVTWAPDGQLESIRLIERAVYDDDPAPGMQHLQSFRDLERGEGAALHAHLFEEAIDWAEPLPLEIPPEGELPARGQESQEKNVQEEREQTALGAVYKSPAHIPDSPLEPAHVIPEESVDKDVKVMTCGPDVESVFWSPPPIPPNQTVAELVGQLNSSNPVAPASGSFDLKAVGLDPNVVAALQNLPPDQLQFFQQFAQQQQQQQQQQESYDQSSQSPFTGLDNWNAAQYSEYGHGYGDDRDRRWSDRGRGHGRGRGRGRDDDGGFRNNKRKPCSFFALGRCKYGDQCDFSHEGPGGTIY